MVKSSRCDIRKVKGPKLKKLRILEMIEADLQLVMRACLGCRMNERVETDKIVSKYNYGSRKGSFIENDLIEKRLMFDHAKKTEEINTHPISDLEACYDRQILELCGLVKIYE